MWLSAQETMKRRLIADAGGRLIDHLAFTDQGHPLATFITTPRWVLTGRRDPFLGLPPAGISPDEIRQARRFGLALADGLDHDREKSGRPMLAGLRAVTVDPRLAISERAGRRAFACGRNSFGPSGNAVNGGGCPSCFSLRRLPDHADRHRRSNKPVDTMGIFTMAQTAP
jgi:hypothetical protein